MRETVVQQLAVRWRVLRGSNRARVAAAVLLWGPPDAETVRTEAPMEFSWVAPNDCVDGAAVVTRAAAQSRGERRAVEASGIVEGSAELGYTLRLSISTDGVAEARELRAASCDELADAAALLLAVAADTSGQVQASAEVEETPAPAEPESLPEPEPEQRPEQQPRPADEPAATGDTEAPRSPQPPRPAKPSLAIAAVVRVDAIGQLFRILPRAAGFGVAGAAGLDVGPARIEARGQYFLAQSRDYGEPSAAGGDFDLWTLGAAACYVPRTGRWAFPLCGGAEAGSMRGRSRGVQDVGDAASAFVALTVDGAVAYAPLRWLALRLGLQGVASVRRPEYHVRDLDLLFRAGPAGMRITGGIEVRFFSRARDR